MTPDAFFLALLIFLLRVLNFSIGTVRLVVITRNRRVLAAAMATIEGFIFAVVMSKVVTDLENLWNLAAYCLGAGVGSYVGMMLESRFVVGYRIVNIFADKSGHEIAVELRKAGFGVTESIAEGHLGEVITLRSVVDRRDVKRLTDISHEIHPDAFIAIEEASGIKSGWIRMPGLFRR